MSKETKRLEDNFARVMKARQFISPAFSLYGGAAGFQTYGVLGKRVFDNVVQVWRRMFVLDLSDPGDQTTMVYEIDSPIVTPYPILKASGHVDRFTDPIVYDKEGRLERVDHYLKARIDNFELDKEERNQIEAQIESCNIDALHRLMERFGEKDRGFGEIKEVNLMLSTHTSYAEHISFLRPETAQGAFTEFKTLFGYNREKLPMGIVNIGKAYRKEVNPTPFTRLREFNQAELEYFYDPKTLEDPTEFYERFKKSKELFGITTINVTTAAEPERVQEIRMLDLVKNRIIQNTLIFQFVVRTLMFCFRIGIDPKKMRIRQHMKDELAHYSSDCWDVEFNMSFDPNKNVWLEIIGISDRGCYDLSAHEKESGQSMSVKRYLDEPKEVKKVEVVSDAKYWGKTYRSDAKALLEECKTKLLGNPKYYLHVFNALSGDGEYTIMFDKPIVSKWRRDHNDVFFEYSYVRVSMEHLKLVEKVETITFEEFIPGVVEPSFGLDRIIYSVFRSGFKIRSGEKENETDPDRTYFTFEKEICPIRYGLISLINDDEHNEHVKAIQNIILSSSSASAAYQIDKSSVSIGKKYARLDEVGTPIVFTVDTETPIDSTVTVRHCDSMTQHRINVAAIPKFFAEADNTCARINKKYREFCEF